MKSDAVRGGLAQYLNCDYYGIDYALSSTKKCMEFFQKPAIHAEAADIPFKDDYFDKSFAYGCFMYFENKQYVERAICEMRRVTRELIFIGELPKESHEEKHLLFTEEEMKKYGFEIIDGWAEPYQKIRFSCLQKKE